MGVGGNAPSILSTTPPPFLLHGPSTPPSSFAHTPSTPQTTGSSFSQTFGRTPCPTNNASAPMPDFSDRMEDAVAASPKHASSRKARGGKPAASQAPAKNGAPSSNMRRPAAQPSALVQLALQLAPAPKAAPPAKAAPPPQPTLPQPAAQPAVATIQATAPQPAAVADTKDSAAAASVWVTNDPAKVFKTPSWPITVAPRWKTIETLPQLGPRAQVWDPVPAIPAWVTNDPAQVFKAPSWSITIAPHWKAVKSLPQLPPGAQVWDPAAAVAPVSQTNDPAQAFKVPSWSITMVPLWKTVKSLPQLPPGAQVWDPVASAPVWQINDPAQILKTPSWPAAIAPLWTRVETLPQLAPGTQVWDAVRSAPAPVWETNDPAQVFKVPSWPIVIVPLWKTVKTLAQLPPGTQVWNLKASIGPAAPQPPSSNNTEPVPAAQPVPSQMPIPSEPSKPSEAAPPSQPSTKHQPMGPSVPATTRVVPRLSLEHSMRSLVGQLASVHISQPETWAWSEPSLFGMYIRDRNKGKNFQAILADLANTRLPEVDSMEGLDTLEPQKGAQEATIPQSLSGPPAAETKGPSPAVADTMVLEQPSEEMISQETSSAGPEPVEQPDIPQPSTSETAMDTGAPTASGDSDQPMKTEAPQPTEEAKPAAAQGQFDFSAGRFQPASAPQLFVGVNNLFEYAPTAPTRRAPTAARKRGGKPRLLKKPTAGGAASQERPYEVGGDDDPDVDLEYDFGKHFSRAARNAAATLPSPPASTSSGTPPPEASPPVEASPAEASPPSETPPPSEASVPAEASPPTPTSPAGPDAQASAAVPAASFSFFAPVSAASFSFSAPPLPSGGLDFSRAAPSPNPRGSRKRMRDSASDFKHDRKDCHSHKLIAEGRLPEDIWKVKQQHKRMKAIVAELRANPFILYDQEYAEDMMDEMYYRTLPRLASEILFPLPRWNEADQEDEAKAFVDSMMEEELNEDSFDMVQKAYLPTREHRMLNMTVHMCREDLFDVFTRWFEDLIVDALPDLVHHMTDDEIIPLGELFEEAVATYFEDHPPKYLA